MPPPGCQGRALGSHVQFKCRLLGDLDTSSTLVHLVCTLPSTLADSTVGCQSRERWLFIRAWNTHFTWSYMNGPSYEMKYDSLPPLLWIFFIFNIIGIFLTSRYFNFSGNLTSLWKTYPSHDLRCSSDIKPVNRLCKSLKWSQAHCPPSQQSYDQI